MRNSKRILILHAPAGGGHRAAANALHEAASHMGHQAEVVDALSFTPGWFAKGYVQMHLTSSGYTPNFYGYGYNLANKRHPIGDGFRRRLDGQIGRRLTRFIREKQADLVIGTHFFPLSVLGRERLAGRMQAPLVGVVTDYTAHAFWVDPGVDAYCCARGGAALDLSRHGIPETMIAETGIPIRRDFAKVTRHSAQSYRGRINVLLTSGGFGIGPLAQAIASFANQPNLNVTVVCGASERRKQKAEAAAKRANVNARIIGFEKDMPARLQEAHVIVGKPGGLTTSEALACGRPMAVMGTCPGQEAHNEQWLCLNHAGVAVDPANAGPRLEQLRRSGELARMARAALRLGRPRAALNVIETGLRLNGEHAAAA